MRQVIEKGSFRVAVHAPLETGQATALDVLWLCAAGARNGSADAVDLAIVHRASKQEPKIPFEQGSWSGMSSERRYTLAQLRRVADGRAVRVARGEMDSILNLAAASPEVRERSRKLLSPLEMQGFVGVGVAVAENAGPWQFGGIVPVRVTQSHPSLKDAPADFRYVHVWDWQLRLLHWAWALLIVLLALSGLLIGEGWVLWYGDLTNGFAFGWIRLVHLTAGWLLASVLIMRAARSFWGSNRYQRFAALVPHSLRSMKDMLSTAKNYLMMRSWKNPNYIGHNPLQQWCYTGILLLLVGMTFTGFSMYAMYAPRNWFFHWFMWPNYLIGAANVRLIHTVGMWVIVLFIPAHIYLSILADNVDRGGAISSMISGGRWARKGAVFVDE